MHIEIGQAVDFLSRLLQTKLDQQQVILFKQHLTQILKARFADHWDTQQPSRGNGYRSISNFNGQLDPVLALAAEKANINPALIHANLPRDFVLWIDPFSVSYRVGDHGSIMTLFEDRSRGRIVFKVDPNSPNTSPLLARTTSLAVRISPPNSPSRNAKQQSSPEKQQQDNIPDHQQQEQQQQDDKNDKLVMAN